MEQRRERKTANGGMLVLLVVLLVFVAVSLAVLFSRVTSYTESEFVNVLSLTDNVNDAITMVTEDDGNNNGKHPDFVMEEDGTIFKLSYDETGKVTVIGTEGNTDHLIAPGTSNLYQFTLRNPGDVSLDYDLEVEAYVTGTEEYLPVNARVWDYKNKYLLGSSSDMQHVLELNTVKDSAELGAGRYAIYNLEWEWPFEWDNDEHDTMLGNLAVENDLELHIVIRTKAWYDEEPDDPDAGLMKPPHTGDDSQLVLLILLCVGSFAGFCAMLFVFFKSSRKNKEEKADE